MIDEMSDENARTGTCVCLSWHLLHLINQSKYGSLLILGQP